MAEPTQQLDGRMFPHCKLLSAACKTALYTADKSPTIKVETSCNRVVTDSAMYVSAQDQFTLIKQHSIEILQIIDHLFTQS